MVQLLCWPKDPPWCCLFFVTVKQESCVRAGRQAPSECQVCVTHQHSAVQSCADEYIYLIFFSYFPPLCTAALKSDFPAIQCKTLVLDGFTGVCGVTSPVSWAAADWNNPTPLRSFSLKSHPAPRSEGEQAGGTGHRSWTCPLKVLTVPEAGALGFEAFICPAEATFAAALRFIQHTECTYAGYKYACKWVLYPCCLCSLLMNCLFWCHC